MIYCPEKKKSKHAVWAMGVQPHCTFTASKGLGPSNAVGGGKCVAQLRRYSARDYEVVQPAQIRHHRASLCAGCGCSCGGTLVIYIYI